MSFSQSPLDFVLGFLEPFCQLNTFSTHIDAITKLYQVGLPLIFVTLSWVTWQRINWANVKGQYLQKFMVDWIQFWCVSNLGIGVSKNCPHVTVTSTHEYKWGIHFTPFCHIFEHLWLKKWEFSWMFAAAIAK